MIEAEDLHRSLSYCSSVSVTFALDSRGTDFAEIARSRLVSNARELRVPAYYPS